MADSREVEGGAADVLAAGSTWMDSRLRGARRVGIGDSLVMVGDTLVEVGGEPPAPLEELLPMVVVYLSAVVMERE